MIQDVDNVDIFRANVDDKVFAKNSELYHGFLFWGPMLFGEFNRFTRDIGGVEVEVVFYGNFAEEQQIYENLFALFSYHSQNIRPLNLPANSTEKIRYIYALLGDDSKIVHSGDHIYGQYTPFNTEDLNESRYREIAHIMAHTWFSTHYRLLVDETAEEFGETTIQFYALRAVSETAVWSSAQVDEHLLIWYEDYRDFILGTQYDVALFPSENWDGFPDEPLESNYSYSLSNTIWYEKGPLAFWVIDRKIRQVSSDSIDFTDVWQYLAMHNPHVEENTGNSYQELLEVTNFLTGYDFAPIFEAYVSGNDPLSFLVSEGVLLWRDAEIPEISPLSDIGLVRHHLKWGLSELDTDDDGLSDELEALLPTYFDIDDSDGDGLSDRQEYGFIMDGKAGERIGVPTISDAHGDTTFPATGGDIADIHSGVFIDENFKRHLYFTMSYHDASPNPELWYELELGYGNGADRLQYRYEQGKSTLYDDNNGQVSELTNGSTGYLKERLEVILSFDYLTKSAYKVYGMTRHFAHDFAISDVDITSSRSVSLQPSMFVTDPMKKDTDGDTIIDSVDNCPSYHNPEQLECDPVIADNDLDGDKRVTQRDVIFGLQIAAGEQHSVTITQHNDANGDGIIGLAEAIGLLQQLATE